MSADGTTMATMWAAEDGPARVTLRPWWGLDRAIAGVARCEHFPGLAEAPIRPGIEAPELDHDPAVHGPRLLPAVHPLDAGSSLEFYVKTIVWQVHDPEGVVDAAVREKISGLPEVDGRYDCPDEAGSIHLLRSGNRFDVMIRPFETPEEAAQRRAELEANKPKTALEAARRQAISMNCITLQSDYVELTFGVKDGKVTSPRVYDIPTSFSNAPAPRKRRTDPLATCLIDEAKSWRFDESFEEDGIVMNFGTRPM